MEEAVTIDVSGTYNLRGSEYIISLECKGNDVMTVQVEDGVTADQWRSSFDAQYIEDLTHKTGNFKQFNIFISMLESAISKSSESVSLDLLTYNDLETLRQKKSAMSSTVKSATIPASRSSHLTAKRYLILAYTVEFDRIHYPLPLPYVGKPDPRVLQEELRALKAELSRAKQHQPSRDYRIEKLSRDYRRLEREKSQIEEEYSAFRREVRLTSSGSAVQDMRGLKTMVKNLEEQLMKEKTRYQRTTSKRSQEYRDLLEEVEELRASERNLRVRVKSLMNELALYKRGRTVTRKSSRERGELATRITSSSRQQSLSNDKLSGRAGSGDRLRTNHSRERQATLHRSNSTEQLSRTSHNGSKIRGRSSSYDRNTSANRSRFSAGSGSNRSRTPSPAAARRFNPTAYIQEKERRKQEIDLKKQREKRADVSGITSRSKHSANSSRNSGSGVRASRENSLRSESNISDGYASDGSYTSRLRTLSNPGRDPKQASYGTSPVGPSCVPPDHLARAQLAKQFVSVKKAQRRVTAAPSAESDDADSEYFDRSAEISEIDERLDRLQQLMQATMP